MRLQSVLSQTRREGDGLYGSNRSSAPNASWHTRPPPRHRSCAWQYKSLLRRSTARLNASIHDRSVNTCAGGQRLARHLADAQTNEAVEVTQVQGLVAQSISGAMAELERLARGARTTQPLAHVIASPQFELSAAQWDDHWAEIEMEFGLTAQPFLEVEHRKIGLGGASLRIAIGFICESCQIGVPSRLATGPRTEKVCRITEFEVGEPAVSGCFNRSVIDALRRDGRHDVADHLAALGLDRAKRPIAAASRERQQAERRRDLPPAEVWVRVWRAWTSSNDAVGLIAICIVMAFASRKVRRAGCDFAGGQRCIVAASSCEWCELGWRSEAASKGHHRTAWRDGSADDRRGPRYTSSRLRSGHLRSRRLHPLAAPDLPPAAHEDREQEQPADTNVETIEPEPELRPLVLTPAEAAVTHFMEMVAVGQLGLRRPHETRQSPRLKRSLMRSSRRRQRSRRIDAELAKAAAALDDWETPTIGLPNWRSRYRAELAGLPEELGSRIRWVERHASITVVHLVNRERVETSPVRATSTECHGRNCCDGGPCKANAWSPVRISGGTAEWRAQAARRMVRAGLTVWNPELQEIAAERQLP